MNKIIRKEKCNGCSKGEMTFIKWEDKTISGSCNYCSRCCNEEQIPNKFTKEQ